MKIEETSPTRCPVCEKELDAVTPIGHSNQMKRGDISLCMWCGELLEWLGDGYQRAESSLTNELPPEQQDLLHLLQMMLRQEKIYP